jgi:hypothetical protein
VRARETIDTIFILDRKPGSGGISFPCSGGKKRASAPSVRNLTAQILPPDPLNTAYGHPSFLSTIPCPAWLPPSSSAASPFSPKSLRKP